MKLDKFFQEGQIGLVVILIMAVGLTIGLAIASQSVTDISISETEERSLRAFNAAEAGIEEALKQDTPTSGSILIGDLTANVEVNPSTEPEKSLARNETMEVTTKNVSTTQVKISWVDKNNECPEDDCNSCIDEENGAPASLEILKVTVTEDENGIVTSAVPYRYLYNSSSCAGLSESNHIIDIADVGADPYLNQVDIDVAGGASTYDVLRIRPLYSQATAKVEGVDAALPGQKYEITSSATTETGETRTVQVTKTIETWPPIFDYVLFSGSQLVH